MITRHSGINLPTTDYPHSLCGSPAMTSPGSLNGFRSIPGLPYLGHPLSLSLHAPHVGHLPLSILQSLDAWGLDFGAFSLLFILQLCQTLQEGHAFGWRVGFCTWDKRLLVLVSRTATATATYSNRYRVRSWFNVTWGILWCETQTNALIKNHSHQRTLLLAFLKQQPKLFKTS